MCSYFRDTSILSLLVDSNGGKIVFATDDWFAVAENLLKVEEPQWQEGVFTAYGKWMDGWETRRKRVAGHDWAIIQLGVPGVVRGVHIDTAHFTGNYVPQISIQAAALKEEEKCNIPLRVSCMGTSATEYNLKQVEKLRSQTWQEIVPMVPLKAGYKETRHHYFPTLKSDKVWTHVRLNLYPDGGIARLRLFGEAVLDLTLLNSSQVRTNIISLNYYILIEFSREIILWVITGRCLVAYVQMYEGGEQQNESSGFVDLTIAGNLTKPTTPIQPTIRAPGFGKRRFRPLNSCEIVILDLVSMVNGGVCEDYSNAHYGHPRNIIRPNEGIGMSDGWETARRLDRPPIIQVSPEGFLQLPGFEWAVFRLGAPGVVHRIEVDTKHFKGNYPDTVWLEGKLGLQAKWIKLLSQTKLSMDKLHVYKELDNKGPFTHVRVNIAPDGMRKVEFQGKCTHICIEGEWGNHLGKDSSVHLAGTLIPSPSSAVRSNSRVNRRKLGARGGPVVQGGGPEMGWTLWGSEFNCRRVMALAEGWGSDLRPRLLVWCRAIGRALGVLGWYGRAPPFVR
uniref:Allantoate amidinohydrolase n=2 Tax=Timema TaxID=61471 RepID=A0A7R9K1K2_TIMGE|nr:unnamed protein product [Timema genevievae]